VVIDADGKIVEAAIAESSTHDMLDAIALEAVASASPFPKPSQAPITIDIPITFKLQ
jgi:TonB family protein